MSAKPSKSVPKHADLELRWLTRELGPRWETWRIYAASWINTKHIGLSNGLESLRAFFQNYLHALGLSSDPAWYLRRSNRVPDFFETACPKSPHGAKYVNGIREFLNWVLEHQFAEIDDHGRPIVLPEYHNPMPCIAKGAVSRHESIHSPLPYRFIRELRDILAPGAHFRDWRWAQEAIGTGKCSGPHGGDWFKVKEEHIDIADPDCVWRQMTSRKKGQLLEIWSPARSVALLVKLMLPLRTYQVRMLDSGEADTWRYTTSGWIVNNGPLASGDERRPVQRGIFRRIEDRETGTTLSGLHINTNKTADIYKEEGNFGYVIPWQHDNLLYWLEKLRNWQEKYNPIAKRTAWTELEGRHIHHAKSAMQLARMPDACFLFRDAAAA
jgi:hypothetical protein